MILGAPQASSSSTLLGGEAWVVLGETLYAATSSTPCMVTGPDARLIGENNSDYLGKAVAGGGDLDNDGFADVVVGAPFVDYGAQKTVGAAYLLYGPVSGTLAASDADAIIYGDATGGRLGLNLSMGGPYDPTATYDPTAYSAGVALAAPFTEVVEASKAGSLYLFFGGFE